MQGLSALNRHSKRGLDPAAKNEFHLMKLSLQLQQCY
jgi:hypothetical protein